MEGNDLSSSFCLFLLVVDDVCRCRVQGSCRRRIVFSAPAAVVLFRNRGWLVKEEYFQESRVGPIPFFFQTRKSFS